MEPGEPDGPWWVHCRCGALNGEHPTEAEAQAAVENHPDSGRRCGGIWKSPCPPGSSSVPMFLLGDDTCTDAAVDQGADGQWRVTCSCAALDSLFFATHEEAAQAMDEHLDAEDSRSRALFEHLAKEHFDSRPHRG